MTQQQRYDLMQAAIADLSLSEAQSAGWSAVGNWIAQWLAFVQNGNLTQPPHKPPF